MLENVENILHIDDGKTVIEIIKQLEAIGYTVTYRLLSTRRLLP